jgi:hypothetical protein
MSGCAEFECCFGTKSELSAIDDMFAGKLKPILKVHLTLYIRVADILKMLNTIVYAAPFGRPAP